MWSLLGSGGVNDAGSWKKFDMPPSSLTGGSQTWEPDSVTAWPSRVPRATFASTELQSVNSNLSADAGPAATQPTTTATPTASAIRTLIVLLRCRDVAGASAP